MLLRIRKLCQQTVTKKKKKKKRSSNSLNPREAQGERTHLDSVLMMMTYFSPVSSITGN
jgi:hypothetical protein